MPDDDTGRDRGRLDHEFTELLDEVRVLLPAVAVLFAFLLTLPFSGQFGSIAKGEQTIYFIAFLCATLALLLLVTPGAHHRLLWRRHDKERLLQAGNVLAITATVFLAIAVSAVVFLVTQRLYGSTLTAAVLGVIIGLVLLLWYGLPLTWRLHR